MVSFFHQTWPIIVPGFAPTVKTAFDNRYAPFCRRSDSLWPNTARHDRWAHNVIVKRTKGPDFSLKELEYFRERHINTWLFPIRGENEKVFVWMMVNQRRWDASLSRWLACGLRWRASPRMIPLIRSSTIRLALAFGHTVPEERVQEPGEAFKLETPSWWEKYLEGTTWACPSDSGGQAPVVKLF